MITTHLVFFSFFAGASSIAPIEGPFYADAMQIYVAGGEAGQVYVAGADAMDIYLAGAEAAQVSPG